MKSKTKTTISFFAAFILMLSISVSLANAEEYKSSIQRLCDYQVDGASVFDYEICVTINSNN